MTDADHWENEDLALEIPKGDEDEGDVGASLLGHVADFEDYASWDSEAYSPSPTKVSA